MFQHGKEHAGIQGEYPVLPPGKPSAFTLRPGILPDRQEKPEMADAYCRNTYPETPLLPLQDGFFEIILTGTPLVFSGEPSLPGVCYDNLPNTLFVFAGRQNPTKGTSMVFFTGLLAGIIRAAPGPHQ